MTFDQFKATRTFHHDGRAVIRDDQITEGQAIFMYAGHLYIEIRPEGDFLLILCNTDFLSRSLEAVELELYMYACNDNNWHPRF